MSRYQTLALTILLIIVGARGEDREVELFVSGGVASTGPNFYVSIYPDGRIEVRKTGLPIVPPGKLTEKRTAFRISKSEAMALFQAARAADNFAEGSSEDIADGTFATLIIESDSEKIERKCHAGEWPKGQKTRLFLKKLNEKLPGKWRVF